MRPSPYSARGRARPDNKVPARAALPRPAEAGALCSRCRPAVGQARAGVKEAAAAETWVASCCRRAAAAAHCATVPAPPLARLRRLACGSKEVISLTAQASGVASLA